MFAQCSSLIIANQIVISVKCHWVVYLKKRKCYKLKFKRTDVSKRGNITKLHNLF